MVDEVETNSEKFSLTSKQYKTATTFICALLFFILPLASLQVGIPGDEPIDAQYGIESLNFYKSFGNDTSFVNLTALNQQTFPYQKYYGALFETVSVSISQLFGTPVYKTRHILVALFAAVIILFTALFTAEIAGWMAAFIAVLLLASSPTFIGNSYFNSKDIPMAMGFIIAFYFFIKLLKQLPRYSTKTILGCIAGIALTIGIRIGGLLLVGYLIVFLLYFISDNDSLRKQLFSSVKSVFSLTAIVLLICFSGVLIGCLFYPNFFLHGFSHITEAMNVAKYFPVKIVMLFGGNLIYAHEITWSYLPVCMGITFPVTGIAGLFIFYVQLYLRRKIFSWQDFILVYTVLFLLVYVVATHQLMYNSWRHVLFIYPIIISTSAIAYMRLYSALNKIYFKAALVILFSVMTIKTFGWMIINHPYEYIYFNEIQGGVKGAYGNYDTDYQQLAATESFEWLLNSNDFKNDTAKNKTLLTNNIALICADQYLPDSMEILESSYVRLNYRPMNYAIMSSIFLDKQVMKHFYPPKGPIHEVKVDGVPISVVVKRENDYLEKGKYFFDHAQLDSAFVYLLRAFHYDADDFRTWPVLGHCYFLKGYPNLAHEMISRYVQYFPEDEMALNELDLVESYIDSLNRVEVKVK